MIFVLHIRNLRCRIIKETNGEPRHSSSRAWVLSASWLCISGSCFYKGSDSCLNHGLAGWLWRLLRVYPNKVRWLAIHIFSPGLLKEEFPTISCVWLKGKFFLFNQRLLVDCFYIPYHLSISRITPPSSLSLASHSRADIWLSQLPIG